MREFLKQATHHMDEAESILRGVEGSVTPWVLIRGSDLFLRLATEHREKVAEARHTYGPDTIDCCCPMALPRLESFSRRSASSSWVRPTTVPIFRTCSDG